jgi:hypothetical protein
MLDIAVLDCCGPDDSAASRRFVEFLRRKFPDGVRVAFYDPEQPSGAEAVPPELFQRLVAQGVNQVPVLVIDGELVSQGSLPDWMASLDLVKSRLNLTAASTPASGSDEGIGEAR